MIRVAIIVGGTPTFVRCDGAVEPLRLPMWRAPGRRRARKWPSRWLLISNFIAFKPAPRNARHVGTMLDQLVPSAVALKTVRSSKRALPLHSTNRNEQFKRGVAT
jgi:hypothetical protein